MYQKWQTLVTVYFQKGFTGDKLAGYALRAEQRLDFFRVIGMGLACLISYLVRVAC